MKILIVGSNAGWAIENYYAKHLNEIGIDTTIFSCSDYYSSSSFYNRLQNRLGIHAFYNSVNESLIELTSQINPTVIWVFKGVEIFPQTLVRLKQNGFILVNYNPDHPFIRTAISHGGASVEQSVSLYDAHFCYSEKLRLQIQKEFNIRTFSLPFAYEPTDFHYSREIISKDFLKVAMIGNADECRAGHIRYLLRNGIEVDVFGNNWSRFLSRSRHLNVHGPVSGIEFWKAMLNYRVQLNVFRPHNEGSHNMRTFEIPSIGGIQLAPYSEEHDKLFKNGSEIWLYTTEDDLVNKADQLLSLKDEIAEEYREKAKRRCETEHYTYLDRAVWVKSCLEKVVKELSAY